MERAKHRSDVALAPRGDPPMLWFTADDGRTLTTLAGEALAKRRGNALRPGLRPVHTTGVFLSGSFTADGATLPLAPAHLTPGSPPVAVTARFSSSDPRLPANDRRHGPRGLAVRLYLSNGATTDLVAMSTDRFLVSTRAAFISVSRAMSSFILLRWIRMGWLTAVRQVRAPVTFALAFPPRSYCTLDYYTVNTFVWAHQQPVRYRWRPVGGPQWRLPWTRLFKHRRYLEHELAERMAEPGAVAFRLVVQCPGPKVSRKRLADAAKPLPRGTNWIPVGTLRLDRIIDGPEAIELYRLVFSPTHLVPGVETYPGDELMATRMAAYSASHIARTGRPL
jgi:catalase